MWNRLIHGALFTLGLLGTASAIRHIDALPFWSHERQELAYAARSLAGYDTVFFGSSRVRYGIIPKEFDSFMAESGRSTHSFNMGISGTHPHETDQIVEWLMAHSQGSIRRVIIELHSWDNTCEGNWMSDQEVELHEFSRLLPRLASVWTGSSSWSEKLWRSYFHVMHSLANAFRVGQAPRILDDCMAQIRGERLGPKSVPDEGYVSIGDIGTDSLARMHKEFLDNEKKYDKSIADKANDLSPPWSRGGFNVGAWRSMHKRLLAAGIEPIYLVMSSFAFDFRGREAIAEVSREAIVLELDRPKENAVLFDHSRWWDAWHFNREGATFFSRYLAERVIASHPKSLAPTGDSGSRESPPTGEAKRLQFDARWVGGKQPRLELIAHDIDAGRSVVAVVSLHSASVLLSGDVHCEVELPGLVTVDLERHGQDGFRARIDASALPADIPLFVQACERDQGKIVRTSKAVQVAPRH